MAKLKFLVGPVACGKTVDLIIKANQLQTIEGVASILILKPTIDTRFSPEYVKSASGLQIKLTHLISPVDNLLDLNLDNVSAIFVDEIQFFTVRQIEQFRHIASAINIDVYCYGLLNDFKTNMFEASKRLFELCDEFKQFATYCLTCKELRNSSVHNLATHNLRISKVNNKLVPIVDGESICIGGIESFLPVCYECYRQATNDINVNINK